MPKHENPHRDPNNPTHRDDDDQRKPSSRHNRERERGPGGEREIFVDLVQRRMGGGATPTAEAYAKAMEQWQQLPGAVQFVAVPAFPKPESDAKTGDEADLFDEHNSGEGI